MFEAALDAVVVCDEQGCVAGFNRSAEEAFQRQRRDVIGRPFAELFAPAQQAEVTQLLFAQLRAQRSQTAAARRQWQAARADGKLFDVEASLARSGARGEPTLTAFLRDVSERTRLEAERAAAREHAGQAVHFVARLQSLTAALAAASTPEEVAHVLVNEGVVALEANGGMVLRPRSDSELELVAQVGLPERAVQALQKVPIHAALPTTLAFRTGAAQWVEDPETYAALFPEFHSAVRELSAAVAALPLLVQGKSLGVMAFRFARRRAFSAQEQAIMATFAKQAAQALDRAELYARERAARRRLQALSDLAEALSQALTRDDVSSVIVDRGTIIAGADTCALYELSGDGTALELIGTRGLSEDRVAHLRRIQADAKNSFFQSIHTGEVRWVENEKQYLELYPEYATTEGAGPRARAFWTVPLISEGKAIGLLGMGFFAERTFPSDEREFVETFVRHCSEALRRAQRTDAERSARAISETLQMSLATTLRSIGDAVIATDAEGSVKLMNPVAEQLTGWTESDARGRPLRQVFTIVNEQTGHDVESPADQALREGVIVGLASDTLLLGRHGEQTPIEDSGAPIRGPDGHVEGVVLVFRDVSEKKASERKRAFLTEATALLAQSLDCEVTLSQVAKLAVPALADWCAVDLVEPDRNGHRRLAVAHKDPHKIEYARELATRYPPRTDAPGGVPQVLRTGKSELYREVTDEMLRASAVDEDHLRISRELGLRSAMIVPLIAREGVLGAMTFVWAESHKAYDEQDLRCAEDLARRCAIAIDNSRLYAAEQQARQAADVANRAKDEFLATVSHELRTPLNAIMGWAKMMSSAELEESKRARAVETIERNAIAMAQLIEDLLDVSRIISGKMRLDVQSVDLGRIVEAALESVKPAAEAKEITLAPMLDSTGDKILGDPTRLQQIVWNLLSNAVKFTPRGGRVEVVLRRVGSVAEVAVSDTGKGIDPRFLPYVFDPFRQEDASSKRARGGLGLGLAITRQLVELHGGQISARSEGEGRGATFVVQLPPSAVTRVAANAQERSARDIRKTSDFERPTALTGLRVLVVDDEPDGRALVRAILEECGCVVNTAASVDEAIAALLGDLPDLLISDIGMPGRDGYDLIRRVRAMPTAQGGNLPAAALTAYARAEDRRQILSAGFSMHIPKPVEPAELVAVAATLARFAQRPQQ